MSTSNQETSDSPPKKERKSWLIWIIGLAAFLFVIAASWYFPYFVQNHYGYAGTDAGTFGDQYGALNTFFSGLAFAGLVIAILLQREDLKLQREEMREARAEAAKQTKEAKAQTALMAQQLQTQQEEMRGARAEAEKQTKEAEAQTALMAQQLQTQQEEMRGARAEAEKQTKEAEAQTTLMAEQMLNTSLFEYLEAMQTTQHRIQTQLSRPDLDIESADIFLSLKNDIIDFIVLLHKHPETNREEFDEWLPKVIALQETILFNIRQSREIFLPVQLWYQRVNHSILSDAKKKEYQKLFFDSLSSDTQFGFRMYEIVKKTQSNLDDDSDLQFEIDDEWTQIWKNFILPSAFKVKFSLDESDLSYIYRILTQSSPRYTLTFFRPRS